MWTLTDDENKIIHVRAIISLVHEADQLRNLIAALQKRLPEEKSNDPTGSAVVRPIGTARDDQGNAS